jgi:uncharacterized Zn finger protein (UPF0148 family)
MTEKHCDYCHAPFVARQSDQRFCTPVCRIEWFADERKEAVRLYREWRQPEAEGRA